MSFTGDAEDEPVDLFGQASKEEEEDDEEEEGEEGEEKEDGEEAEIKGPSSRKIIGQSVIFETRDLPGPLRRWLGVKSGPVLCDFGESMTTEK